LERQLYEKIDYFKGCSGFVLLTPLKNPYFPTFFIA